MRVALVHDWLNGMRGGEKVLQAFGTLFPDAKIFTLFCDPDKISAELKKHEIATSFIQNFPERRKYYRHLLPVFPYAIERFDFSNADLVISNSHCVAKGAITGKDTLHVCYCLSPMRYIWDRFDDYFPRQRMTFIRHSFIKAVAARLRKWDVDSSKRVNLFVADSHFVQDRIKRYYNRPSKVIYPFAETEYFTPGTQPDGDFFLMVGALVPYKKAELVVEAFRGLKEKLVVIGDGPDLFRLVNIAPDNVSFTGWLDEESIRTHYRQCRALIFPGVEDFGIVPVEAQACGKPVIAFGEGGILDIIAGIDLANIEHFNDTTTGLFFKSQTSEAIRETIKVFNKFNFNRNEIRNNALRFSKGNFYSNVRDFLTEAYALFRNDGKAKLEERLIK